MQTGPMSLFRRALRKAPAVHPLDRQVAKRCVKARLLVVYPELRYDPKALEAAYQALDLKPCAGSAPGEAHSYFEVVLPFPL